MQKDSAQAKISLKVVGGLLFLTHPVDEKPYRWLYQVDAVTARYREHFGDQCYAVLFIIISAVINEIFV